MLNLPKMDSKIAKDEITDFIKEKTSEANAKGIVIGLSGGIDSSVVGYLAVETLGKENVFGVHMYSSTTPNEDTKHAREMATLLDINYREISIDDISEEILQIADSNKKYIEEKYPNTEKIAKGNLNARIRMCLLYYYANLKNSIVIGTGNRSELLIGYFTKYGDGGCDIEPIGNIYKSQLRKLAKDWEIPEEIISKPPRAGLWPGQSDESEIGLSYDILDSILYLMIDKELANEEIANTLKIKIDEINRIRTMIKNNAHKLQAPLSPWDCDKSF